MAFQTARPKLFVEATTQKNALLKLAKRNKEKEDRATLNPKELVSQPEPGIDTLYDAVERPGRVYPTGRALGYRDTIKIHNEKKEIEKVVDGKTVKESKNWQYYELTPYKYYNYTETLEIVREIGAGLVELGLNKSTHFNIFATTSPQWLMVAMACFSNTITFCTAYDSLGSDGLQHSLNEPEVVGVFTDATLLRTMADAVAKTPTVKYIIYHGELEGKDKDVPSLIAERRSDVRVLTLDELRKIGRDSSKAPERPKPDDIACIMYTSGSTGKPKGVILTHRNLVASVGGVLTLLADFVKYGETYIAYLPLAHVLEFIVELSMFYVGIPLGYGNVKTLTDANVRNCKSDLVAFRPTIMCGVPAVWELIKKGIEGKVRAGGAIKSRLFHGAMALKQTSPMLFGGLTDAVVFGQVKAATGGKLKYALSGGAGISNETHQFLLTALTRLIQGYGMTESCGMCAILPPSYPRTKSVGVPVPSIEIKLVDVADAGYFSKNTPPQGEIFIRGNSVTKGYYKRDDVNKETFTEDGWLMTGDIGQWNSDGTLSIIDRKKNLVKLSGGEYIALEKLEATYKGCSVVSNIMVYADSNANKPLAVVFPHEKNLQQASGVNNDLESLCKDENVKKAALDALNSTGKKAGFKALEMLQDVILVPEEWTPQNGLVTAAQKLNRKGITDKYKDRIDAIYP